MRAFLPDMERNILCGQDTYTKTCSLHHWDAIDTFLNFSTLSLCSVPNLPLQSEQSKITGNKIFKNPSKFSQNRGIWHLISLWLPPWEGTKGWTKLGFNCLIYIVYSIQQSLEDSLLHLIWLLISLQTTLKLAV